MLKRDALFPYLIISIFLHVTVYFLFHVKEKPVFLSAPVEVSFYSPSRQKAEQSPAAFFERKAGQETVSAREQIRNSNAKEDAVVKKKKVTEEKADSQKLEERPESQIKTDTKKSDEQSVKPVEEKKVEKTSPSGNSGNVETFQAPDSDRPPAGTGSQYEVLSFDARDFKYSYYKGQIVRKIERCWVWSESYRKLRVLVYFKIRRDGTAADISVRESSGNGGYDKYALDTIRRASPFPDLPDGYENDSLGVFFEFKNRN
ncbi:MAG: TonB family protein [Endomicrobium sp.]|jgi:protein TonB|nr:TonB family protein [Endomicrobium sp.]